MINWLDSPYSLLFAAQSSRPFQLLLSVGYDCQPGNDGFRRGSM